MGNVQKENPVVLTWEDAGEGTEEGNEGKLRKVEGGDDGEMIEISDGEDDGGGAEGNSEEEAEEGDEAVLREAEEGDFNEENEVNTEGHNEEEIKGSDERKPDGDAEGILRKSDEGDFDQKNEVKSTDEKITELKGTDEGDEEDTEGDDEDDESGTEEVSDAFSQINQEDEGRRRKMKTATEDGSERAAAGVRAYLVVGTQKGWEAGRVEEKQLRDSAALFSYDYQVSKCFYLHFLYPSRVSSWRSLPYNSNEIKYRRTALLSTKIK